MEAGEVEATSTNCLPSRRSAKEGWRCSRLHGLPKPMCILARCEDRATSGPLEEGHKVGTSRPTMGHLTKERG